jgi:hypothetical protein
VEEQVTKSLINLVGYQYSSLKSLLPLKSGMNVLLLREPSNPHDPNAVRVYIDIGYITSRQAPALVLDLIDAGLEQIEGRIVRVAATYAEIEIEDPQPKYADRWCTPDAELGCSTPPCPTCPLEKDTI